MSDLRDKNFVFNRTKFWVGYAFGMLALFTMCMLAIMWLAPTFPIVTIDLTIYVIVAVGFSFVSYRKYRTLDENEKLFATIAGMSDTAYAIFLQKVDKSGVFAD